MALARRRFSAMRQLYSTGWQVLIRSFPLLVNGGLGGLDERNSLTEGSRSFLRNNVAITWDSYQDHSIYCDFPPLLYPTAFCGWSPRGN
ncbi:hypothetical protein BKA82DRAFT_4194245 [Pisolithus tinctorius]|nr:hypothetical protein BKA82DRAFT_4194245 [Pisolithus tinctorius]